MPALLHALATRHKPPHGLADPSTPAATASEEEGMHTWLVRLKLVRTPYPHHPCARNGVRVPVAPSRGLGEVSCKF